MTQTMKIQSSHYFANVPGRCRSGNLTSLWAGRGTLYLYVGQGIVIRKNDGRGKDDRGKDVVPQLPSYCWLTFQYFLIVLCILWNNKSLNWIELKFYKLSLQLYKTFNHSLPAIDWNLLQDNIIFTSRQTKFKTLKQNRLRLGMTLISNRYWLLNDKIPLDWPNFTLETFKIKMKEMFITNWWDR